MISFAEMTTASSDSVASDESDALITILSG